MILATFRDCDHAELTLINLSDAWVSSKDISIISKSQADIDALGYDKGDHTMVWNDTVPSKLKVLGIKDDVLTDLFMVIEKGGCIMLISGDHIPEEVAQEILEDNDAENVTLLSPSST
jgi:hypothetical protein